jgi:hypothetical protein
MSKVYKGKIVILRPKTNSGIVVFDDGGKSEVVHFDQIYEDGDIVEVSFKNDGYKNELQSIRTVPVTYFGRISNYNTMSKNGQLLLYYPKMVGMPVRFNLNSISSNDGNKEYFLEIIASGLYSKQSLDQTDKLIFISYKPVNVKMALIKENDRYTISNVELIKERNSESFKCKPPIFGYFKNLKKSVNIGVVEKIMTKENMWFGFIGSEIGNVYFDNRVLEKKPIEGQNVFFEYEKKLVFDKRLGYKTEKLTATKVTHKIEISSEKESFFEIVSDEDICYVYKDKLTKILDGEIHKLDLNCISDLVNCYKSANDSIKIKIVDHLIEAELKIIKLDPVSLINDKIEILKRLSVADKKYFIELQKITYKPEELKGVGSSISSTNLDVEDTISDINLENHKTINIDLKEYSEPEYKGRSPVFNIEIEGNSEFDSEKKDASSNLDTSEYYSKKKYAEKNTCWNIEI